MSCADDATLWQHAEGTLDEGARGALDAHAASCERCHAKLEAIGQTRAVLRAASAASPELSWRKADDAVLTAATEHFARQSRWRIPWWSLLGAAAAAALAVAVWAPWNRAATPAAPIAAVDSLGPVLADVRVEQASGAHIASVDGTDHALSAGGEVRQGARIRTDAGGNALVRLPEKSRAWISARSEATVAQATPEQIQLQLKAGAVFVEAAHVQRKEFLVDAELAQVRVVGTAFGVDRQDGRVVVTVAEGRVLVEPRSGQSRLVGAGQRVVVEADGTYSEEAPLRTQDRDEFARRGVEIAEAAPAPAVAPTPPAQAEQPVATAPRAPVAGSGEPRNNANRNRPSGGSGGLVASATEPPAANPVQSPAAGGAEPTPPVAPQPTETAQAPTPTQPPAPGSEEWKTPEFKGTQPPIAAQSPGLAERANKNGLPITAEGLFLQRAQEALRGGQCGNYMLGLQDVIEASEDPRARETARILRARCFDDQLKPSEAATEYRKYLKQFPAGRYADEARRAVAE